MLLSLSLACGGPPETAPPPEPVHDGAPRSPEAAAARLRQLGWPGSCDGGVLGDGPGAEISYECTATGSSGTLVVSAVTTALPLPAPDEGAARHVGDLWVEVRLSPAASGPIDAEASTALLRAFAGLPAAP